MTSHKQNLTTDFLSNRITLHCPVTEEISTAYENLPSAGTVEVTSALAELPAVQVSLENAGFIAITILSTDVLNRGVRVVAYKGKDGRCFETGKSATYTGGAYAALDDDRHLLFGKMRICEKTAVIYQLPAYKKFVKVTGGNSALITRLQTNPEPFDCDTFETDVSRLASELTDVKYQTGAWSTILYPGPFKMLIMKNGTIIRRGLVVKLPASLVQSLVKSDSCLIISGRSVKLAENPNNFITAYKKHGVLCLIKSTDIEVRFNSADSADLTILDETPDEMKQRLIKLIKSKSEYFMITGSDARDLAGCCPSDGVKAANLLVEAGVLQVARTDVAPAMCPVNIYAFAGEITTNKTHPQFMLNPKFREQVREHLERTGKPNRSLWLNILRWSLLLFVVICLVVMVWKSVNRNRTQINDFLDLDLVNEFDLPFENGLLILQFHRTQRCKFCNDMEHLTRTALSTYFSSELKNKGIAFRLVNMELPRFVSLSKEYDIFTSTIVLFELQAGRVSRWQIFTDAWYLTDKKQEFLQAFQSEFNKFQSSSK